MRLTRVDLQDLDPVLVVVHDELRTLVEDRVQEAPRGVRTAGAPDLRRHAREVAGKAKREQVIRVLGRREGQRHLEGPARGDDAGRVVDHVHGRPRVRDAVEDHAEVVGRALVDLELDGADQGVAQPRVGEDEGRLHGLPLIHGPEVLHRRLQLDDRRGPDLDDLDERLAHDPDGVEFQAPARDVHDGGRRRHGDVRPSRLRNDVVGRQHGEPLREHVEGPRAGDGGLGLGEAKAQLVGAIGERPAVADARADPGGLEQGIVLGPQHAAVVGDHDPTAAVTELLGEGDPRHRLHRLAAGMDQEVLAQGPEGRAEQGQGRGGLGRAVIQDE